MQATFTGRPHTAPCHSSVVPVQYLRHLLLQFAATRKNSYNRGVWPLYSILLARSRKAQRAGIGETEGADSEEGMNSTPSGVDTLPINEQLQLFSSVKGKTRKPHALELFLNKKEPSSTAQRRYQ